MPASSSSRNATGFGAGFRSLTAGLGVLLVAAFATAALAQPSATPPAAAPAPAPVAADPAAPAAANPVPTAAPTTAAPTTTAAPAAADSATDSATPNTPVVAPPEVPDSPVTLRLRDLERRVQALKERAWRQKARVGMLKEAALGSGTAAQATLVHLNKMGSSFRLTKLVYILDGTQIFARTDDAADTLYKTKSFDILSAPINPGSHTLDVAVVYRGHGYGVFKYLTKYTYERKASQTFVVEEGKATRVEISGYEKGNATTPLDKRPAIEFKVSSTMAALPPGEIGSVPAVTAPAAAPAAAAPGK